MSVEEKLELLRTEIRAHAERIAGLDASLAVIGKRLHEHEDAIVDDRKSRIALAEYVQGIRNELRNLSESIAGLVDG